MNKSAAFLKMLFFLSKTGVENIQISEMDEFNRRFWKKRQMLLLGLS